MIGRMTVLWAVLLGLCSSSAFAAWTSGETSMTRLTPDERALRLNPNLPAPVPGVDFDPAAPPPPAPRAFPAYFNWRDKDGRDWTTPVRSQGGCGSCWAFGSLAALEAAINIYVGDADFDYDLSEQAMVSCGLGSCDYGGFAEEVMYNLKNVGIPDEACHPYEESEGDCNDRCSDWAARAVKIDAWGPLYGGLWEDQIKEKLLLGPLAVTMQVYDDFYGYRSGVYAHDGCALASNHIVLLIGWNDANGSWIAKNSWDTDWGDDGFFEIKRGSSCFALSAYWLTVNPMTIPTATKKLCGDAPAIELFAEAGQSDGDEETFTLSNCGPQAVNWSAEYDALLLDVSPDAGHLEAGETARVAIKVDAAALDPGTTTLPLIFHIEPEGGALPVDVNVHVAPAAEDGDVPDGDEAADGDAIVSDGDADLIIDGDDAPADGDAAEDGDASGDEPAADGDAPLPDGDNGPDGSNDGDADTTPNPDDVIDAGSAPDDSGCAAQAATAWWLLLAALPLWRRVRRR
ncbi:MAG: hypothetical protein C4523_07180 [Myxococcales bacterium]|nr:MAG: hypothetical protein C4523_07180 [Myxococcales bacterium]